MTEIARFAHISAGQYLLDAADFDEKMAVDEIPLPRRATAGSAGYDFVCPVGVTLAPGSSGRYRRGCGCSWRRAGC